MNWQADAACRGMDTNIWFDEDRVDEAAAICDTCPVMAHCLDHALMHEPEGVWGGLTGRQRRSERRRRQRNARVEASAHAAGVTLPPPKTPQRNAQLRRQVVDYLRKGGGIADAARQFGVNKKTVYRWDDEDRTRRTA